MNGIIGRNRIAIKKNRNLNYKSHEIKGRIG